MGPSATPVLPGPPHKLASWGGSFACFFGKFCWIFGAITLLYIGIRGNRRRFIFHWTGGRLEKTVGNPFTSDLLFILAAALLSLGLRSFSHPVLRKLGSFAILGTSFYIGYFLSGHWEMGALFVASWLMLPWLEILTRVRKARLPKIKPLRRQFPPSREVFPNLGEFTGEMEAAGFERVDDAGWDWGDHRQFFRLFYKSDERLQAAICLVAQDDIAFYYLSISSRGKDGHSWTTWNYPFSYSMKFAPQFRTQRLRGERTVAELMAAHREFLSREGVDAETLVASGPDEIQLGLERDLERQIAHNLARGLLLPVDEEMVRYSWRGMLFIWLQFLRDFVRLS